MCGRAKPLDLAVLKHIPHIRLLSRFNLNFALTQGSWQSLETIGARGIHVAFSDLNAFVRHTKLFSFSYSCRPHSTVIEGRSAAMMEDIRAICGMRRVDCYMTSHRKNDQNGPEKVVRLSNRKLNPPHDKEEVLSGSESAIWQLAESKCLYPTKTSGLRTHANHLMAFTNDSWSCLQMVNQLNAFKHS